MNRSLDGNFDQRAAKKYIQKEHEDIFAEVQQASSLLFPKTALISWDCESCFANLYMHNDDHLMYDSFCH